MPNKDDRNQSDKSFNSARRRVLSIAVAGTASAILAPYAVSAEDVIAQPDQADAPPLGDYVIANAAIISMDDTVGTLRKGSIHVKDGKIAAIAETLDIPGTTVIDAAGKIAMPGLCDTHWHMWNSLFKNLTTRTLGYNDLKAGLGPHHTPHDFYAANRLALAEALNYGVTSVLNYAHNVRSPEHADEEIRAMVESGLRGRYAYAGNDPVPRDQPLDQAEIRRIYDQWFGHNGLDAKGRMGLAIAERAPAPEVDPAVDRRIDDWLYSFELGVPLVLHSGGTSAGNRRPSTMLGRVPIDHTTLFVHGGGYDERDVEILQETGASQTLAVPGYFISGRGQDMRSTLHRFLAAGVNLSLSIDASSINSPSMLDHMRFAYHIASPEPQADYPEMPPITPAQCLRLGTINGVKGLSFGDVSGSLTVGKQADIILLNGRTLNMAPAGDDLERSVLLSAMVQDIETVIVDGDVLKWQGKVISMDVEQVRQDAVESLHNIRKRAGGDLAPLSEETPLI